jgi:hypothetical protein
MPLLRRVARPLLALAALGGMGGLGTEALALRQVWNESLPGIHTDQGDVVRLPNVSQQVAYYVVIREMTMATLVPRRYVPSHVHAAEWDDVAARYEKELAPIPLRTVPSENRSVALRLVLGGWIGAGMLNQNGRIDGHNSFMPRTVPLKIRWTFEKAVPRELRPHLTSALTVDIDLPNAKVLDRHLVVEPFVMDEGIPAQTSTMTVTLNGHALKPMEVRFSGKRLQLPEYLLDASDRAR